MVKGQELTQRRHRVLFLQSGHRPARDWAGSMQSGLDVLAHLIQRADVLVDFRLSSGSPERPPKRAGGRVPARHLAGIAPKPNKRRQEYKLPGKGLRR